MLSSDKRKLNELMIFVECVGVCGGPYMNWRPRASRRLR